MKKIIFLFFTGIIIISCSEPQVQKEEVFNQPLITENENENSTPAPLEEEKKPSYWDKVKKWSSDRYDDAKNWSSSSYKSSKKWVSDRWPDAKKWGDGAIEKIGKMATDLGEEMKKVEINAFSLEDDKKFGKELYNEIHRTPSEYTVLSRSRNSDTYDRLERIIQDILNSGKVKNSSAFDWTLTVIDDDETVNAMCAPGGYIFVYTGLLDFVDNDSELAGILAHEVAHADKRHGTRQLTAVYGVQFLIAFLTGSDSEVGAQIAAGLLNLKHSRDHERQADEYSVKYLCNTSYNANGVAQFFSKFEQSGNALEELISTHPNHEERITKVNEYVRKYGCEKSN